MKNLDRKFFQNPLIKYLLLVIITISGIIIFQGQDLRNWGVQPNGVVYDTWRVSNDIFPETPKPPSPMVVVTDANGYDNFNMGSDNAETSIANNPNNPLWFFNGWNMNPVTAGSATHHTENGYDPWAINNPAGESGSSGDPWCQYDSLGNLYYINLNSTVTGTWVVKSTNNGLTWGSVISGCTGNDRENICCDQTGGPYANYVYCGETNGSSASFYRSTDHGATFQSMATLTPHQLPGVMIAVGPSATVSGGCIYVTTYTYTGSYFPQTYHIQRSTNGGVSFSEVSSITGIGFAGIDGGAGRGSINGISISNDSS